MVVKRRKKIRKKRGRLRGDSGKTGQHRRGAGNRGGRGRAGVGKKGTEHKKFKYLYDLGKRGFTPPLAVRRVINAINIDQLNNLIDKVKEDLEKDEKGRYIIDLNQFGYNKLLGRGSPKYKIHVIVKYCSKTAENKLKNMGSIVELR